MHTGFTRVPDILSGLLAHQKRFEGNFESLNPEVVEWTVTEPSARKSMCLMHAQFQYVALLMNSSEL